MLGGTELIRKKLGKDAYAMTITLLMNSEGKKMGKTASGAVWLDPNKTSPYEFYQYWRNVGDDDVLKCIRMLTFLPLEEIDKMDAWEGAQLNTAKEILAYELTSLVHGEEEAKKAQETARGLFSKGGDTANMPATGLSAADLTDGSIGILELMLKCGLVPSKGEARRLVQQGGVEVAGEKVKDIGFAVTGIWWFLVTLPLIRNYRQVNYVDTRKHAIGDVLKKIGRTLKTIALHDKKVLFFLLAFFLYIDGVGTIIDNCINIGTDLGLDTVGQVVFLLATQVVAWIGSLVFASLSKKHATVPLILICIIGYFCVCLYALTLQTIWHFGILAFGVGCFQGSIQSLSRSYYSKIIPPENSGEYFGIYDIFSKGASFLGSAVIAWVKLAGGTINIAVASLAVFFALGFVFLKISDRQPASNRQ